MVALGKSAVHVAARDISKGAFGDTYPATGSESLESAGESGPALLHKELAVDRSGKRRRKRMKARLLRLLLAPFSSRRSGKPRPMLSGFLSLCTEVRGKIKTSRESYNYSPRT